MGFARAAEAPKSLGVVLRAGGGVGVRAPVAHFAEVCAQVLNPETAARLAGDRYMVTGIPVSWSSAAMASALQRMGWDAHAERGVYESGGATRKCYIRSTNAPPCPTLEHTPGQAPSVINKCDTGAPRPSPGKGKGTQTCVFRPPKGKGKGPGPGPAVTVQQRATPASAGRQGGHTLVTGWTDGTCPEQRRKKRTAEEPAHVAPVGSDDEDMGDRELIPAKVEEGTAVQSTDAGIMAIIKSLSDQVANLAAVVQQLQLQQVNPGLAQQQLPALPATQPVFALGLPPSQTSTQTYTQQDAPCHTLTALEAGPGTPAGRGTGRRSLTVDPNRQPRSGEGRGRQAQDRSPSVRRRSQSPGGRVKPFNV